MEIITLIKDAEGVQQLFPTPGRAGWIRAELHKPDGSLNAVDFREEHKEVYVGALERLGWERQ